MLISEEYKFIYITIPKTGTSSFAKILDKFTNNNKCIGKDGKQHMYPKFGSLSHIDINMAANVVDIQKYFKFCTFRNPYERAISSWAFKTRNGKIGPNILEFYKKFEIKPQMSYITDENGKILMDYIIKLEDYKPGLEHVCNKIGINIDTELPCVNKTEHEGYEYYIKMYPELKDIIEKKFAADIEVYNKL